MAHLPFSSKPNEASESLTESTWSNLKHVYKYRQKRTLASQITFLNSRIPSACTHFVVQILIKREWVAGGNPDFQNLLLSSLLHSIISSVGGAKDRGEGHSVAISRHMRVHLLEDLIDEQSYVVLLFAIDGLTVDDARLSDTETEDTPITVDEGANVLCQYLCVCVWYGNMDSHSSY